MYSSAMERKGNGGKTKAQKSKGKKMQQTKTNEGKKKIQFKQDTDRAAKAEKKISQYQPTHRPSSFPTEGQSSYEVDLHLPLPSSQSSDAENPRGRRPCVAQWQHGRERRRTG